MENDNVHTPSSSSVEEAIYDCGICHFSGPESACLAHSDAEHAMRPVYECRHCGFAFWKEFDLSLHLRSAHRTQRGQPARECMFCALLCDTPEALNSHLREAHSPSQPIMCRFCGVLCRGGDMVARHVHEMHASTEFLFCNVAKSSDASDPPDGEAGRCTAHFMSPVALAEHMAVVHGVPQKKGDARSGGLLVENAGPNARDATLDARPESALTSGPDSGHGSTMNAPMDVPMDVLMSNADGIVSLAKNEDNLTRLSPFPEPNFACVVCGLRMGRVKDLNDHMSKLHRTCEAVPVNITHGSLEAAVSESLLSPDRSKRCARAFASISRQKSKPCKPSRWTSELDEMFLREIREKGFSNDTLAAFQALYTSDRSMASLRARGYQKGFKMVRSTPKGS